MLERQQCQRGSLVGRSVRRLVWLPNCLGQEKVACYALPSNPPSVQIVVQKNKDVVKHGATTNESEKVMIMLQSQSNLV